MKNMYLLSPSRNPIVDHHCLKVKATEQYFSVLLFIMLYTLALRMTIQIRVLSSTFLSLFFVMLALTFEHVNNIPRCHQYFPVFSFVMRTRWF